MSGEKSSDSSVRLPAYLKIIDSKVLVGVLIPLSCWLFFMFMLNDLPSPQYKHYLFVTWYMVLLLFLPTVLFTFLLVFVLKDFGIKVYGLSQYGVSNELLPIQKLYETLLHTAGLKRLLIWFVILIKASIPFFGGWCFFVGPILFFATASHL